jgi:DNA-binding transcriptional ArsR family regulator
MVDARLFQALSDPTRLKILLLLSRSTMNVTAIVNDVRATQPAVSRHLRVLREASLINHLRKGKEVEYSLNLPKLRDAKLYIEALTGGMGQGEGPQVVEVATPAASAPAVRSAGKLRRKGPKASAKTAKRSARSVARPATREPSKPVAVKSNTDYVVEREEDESMDDFLL